MNRSISDEQVPGNHDSRELERFTSLLGAGFTSTHRILHFLLLQCNITSNFDIAFFLPDMLEVQLSETSVSKIETFPEVIDQVNTKRWKALPLV